MDRETFISYQLAPLSPFIALTVNEIISVKLLHIDDISSIFPSSSRALIKLLVSNGMVGVADVT